MIKKIFFFILILFMSNNYAMEGDIKEAPRLTRISADVIAQQLANTIHQKTDLSWFKKTELPHEVAALVNASLTKYFGNIYWKKINNTSEKTLISQSPISRVAVSPDSNFIIIEHPNIAQGDIPEILDIKKGEWVDHLSEKYKSVLEMTKKTLKSNTIISPDMTYKLIQLPTDGFGTTKIEIRDVQTNKLLYRAKSLQGTVNSIDITPDSTSIVVNYIADSSLISGVDVIYHKEGKVIIWDARTGKTLHQFSRPIPGNDRGLNLLINSTVMSRDGSLLIVAYNQAYRSQSSKAQDKGFIDIFDIKTGNLLHSFDSAKLNTQDALITSVAISPDNTFVVIGYNNGQVKIIRIDPSTINLSEVVHELYDESVTEKLQQEDPKQCVIS